MLTASEISWVKTLYDIKYIYIYTCDIFYMNFCNKRFKLFTRLNFSNDFFKLFVFKMQMSFTVSTSRTHPLPACLHHSSLLSFLFDLLICKNQSFTHLTLWPSSTVHPSFFSDIYIYIVRTTILMKFLLGLTPHPLSKIGWQFHVLDSTRTLIVRFSTRVVFEKEAPTSNRREIQNSRNHRCSKRDKLE